MGRLEHDTRQAAFQANVEKIKKHNSEGHSYTLGLNEWADLTGEEFFKMMSQPYQRIRPLRVTYLNITAEDSVDWVGKGAVTPVKNQGQCGSCWAFSTTGSTEGRSQIANGQLISLSEQQLVDCDTRRDHGCGGGLMDYGFEYIQSNGGIDTEDVYKYKARDGTCDKTKEAKHVVTVTGYKDVPQNDPDQLRQAVSQGPVSIAIEADKSSFQLYNGGVFDGNCGTNLDHGVLVVGYGSDNGQDYWKVKNSWGASWGEQGYIRLVSQDSGAGQCGMYKQPSYPVLADLAQLLHLDQPLHQDHQLDLMKTQLMAVDLTKWQSEFKVLLETSAPHNAKDGCPNALQLLPALTDKENVL